MNSYYFLNNLENFTNFAGVFSSIEIPVVSAGDLLLVGRTPEELATILNYRLSVLSKRPFYNSELYLKWMFLEGITFTEIADYSYMLKQHYITKQPRLYYEASTTEKITSIQALMKSCYVPCGESMVSYLRPIAHYFADSRGGVSVKIITNTGYFYDSFFSASKSNMLALDKVVDTPEDLQKAYLGYLTNRELRLILAGATTLAVGGLAYKALSDPNTVLLSVNSSNLDEVKKSVSVELFTYADIHLSAVITNQGAIGISISFFS
jgi:hypothetical protein